MRRSNADHGTASNVSCYQHERRWAWRKRGWVTVFELHCMFSARGLAKTLKNPPLQIRGEQVKQSPVEVILPDLEGQTHRSVPTGVLPTAADFRCWESL